MVDRCSRGYNSREYSESGARGSRLSSSLHFSAIGSPLRTSFNHAFDDPKHLLMVFIPSCASDLMGCYAFASSLSSLSPTPPLDCTSYTTALCWIGKPYYSQASLLVFKTFHFQGECGPATG